jgi:hypothetical protein
MSARLERSGEEQPRLDASGAAGFWIENGELAYPVSKVTPRTHDGCWLSG